MSPRLVGSTLAMAGCLCALLWALAGDGNGRSGGAWTGNTWISATINLGAFMLAGKAAQGSLVARQQWPQLLFPAWHTRPLWLCHPPWGTAWSPASDSGAPEQSPPWAPEPLCLCSVGVGVELNSPGRKALWYWLSQCRALSVPRAPDPSSHVDRTGDGRCKVSGALLSPAC